MPRRIYFITHPEVRVEPAVPVPEWSLSERGRQRMHSALARPWMRELSAVYCSCERKAIEGAEIIGSALGLPVAQRAALGEVDRSATGYLPHAEHEALADQLFAHPDASARGWESARHAQARVVRAVSELLAADSGSGAVAVVSHGAVGAFLLCQLAGTPIARQHDQPGSGGGNYFAFSADPLQLVHGWRRLET